jgi:carbon monoxide dehydrogenase subunit G
MGKVTFTSDKRNIQASVDDVFVFLSDIENFKILMPDQLQSWESEGDYCRFIIKGLPRLDMKVGQKIENKSITLLSGEESPVEFSLHCQINEEKKNSEAIISLDADLSHMLKMLASGPLQNLVNIMVEKLEAYFKA